MRAEYVSIDGTLEADTLSQPHSHLSWTKPYQSRASRDMPLAPAGRINLGDLLFTAKIDYAKFQSARNGKIQLPTLYGRVYWAASEHYGSFTVHDPTPEDICALAKLALPLLELEVAVDVRPRPHIPLQEREALFGAWMTNLARQLKPGPASKIKAFRGFYRAGAASPKPFNRRLPDPGDQLLYGHKTDPCQTKAYWKRRNDKEELALERQVCRVEARLGTDWLRSHGILTAGDLASFNFRRRLLPFFSHVEQVKTKTNQAQGGSRATPDPLAEWKTVGVGAFVPGGRAAGADVRFVRNRPVNVRIGQALHRLGQTLATPEESVRPAAIGSAAPPGVARPGEARNDATYNLPIQEC
jgi:hypothetical protein